MQGIVRLHNRAVLRVAGAGSATFLQGLCTQDVNVLASQPAAPAAFLSPRGRVLCDTILVARDTNEFLIDCHAAMSKSLLRLLLRHRLREPLEIQDISSTYAVVAKLPSKALPTSQGISAMEAGDVPEGFFRDPRYAAMGHRSIVHTTEDDRRLDGVSDNVSLYDFWRLCCVVPEGPADLPVDSALPLHCNLDLLNFVSFSKGCYIGQELTTRTKHKGAVRKRFVFVASASSDPQAFMDGLRVEPYAPVSASVLQSVDSQSLPVQASEQGNDDADGAQTVRMQLPGSDSWQPVGILHSVANNVGLCSLKIGHTMNHAEDFKQPVLPTGARLSTAGGIPLGMRPPPYAFVD